MPESNDDARKRRGATVERAIAYLEGLKPKVDQVARVAAAANPVPMAIAKLGGVTAPAKPESASDVKDRELQMQLDAYQHAQRMSEIKAARERLLRGN